MLTHDQIWAAIDALAEKKQLTASGLARNSGLDPTSFNKSKRHTANGRQRWPSSESIAKALRATQITISEFCRFAEEAGAQKPSKEQVLEHDYPIPGSQTVTQNVPLLGIPQDNGAGAGGFFDSGGYPSGLGWDAIHFPTEDPSKVYALEVSGNSMLPLYNSGDMLIIAPGENVRNGDRIIFITDTGEMMAKILARKTAMQLEIQSDTPDEANTTYPLDKIEWIARILWASQ